MTTTLAIAVAVGGCDLINAATADKLDSEQQDALGDLLTDLGQTASVMGDPASASSQDLADAMELDQYVRFTGAARAGAARLGGEPAGPVPACLSKEGNFTTATDCQIPVGARTCVVNGSATSTPEGAGTRYEGMLSMNGEGCPERTITFDFLLTGPNDKPTALDGTADFTENDPPNNVYSGHLALQGIGIADGCDRPSKGKLTVSVEGTFDGKPVDDSLTITFNASPECGVILIE